MIRLGLRLTLNGGKETLTRLVLTALAVSLGVAMLLVALSAMNAVQTEAQRAAWLETSGVQAPSGGPQATSTQTWWLATPDVFENQPIVRIDLAARATSTLVIPGIAHLPGPGQFIASPALTALLRSTARAELADRFPGRQIGEIGDAGLPSPNSLVMVVGHSAAELSRIPGVTLVTAVNTMSGTNGIAGSNQTTIEIILAVGAVALLLPILIFIGTATRLSAARREQRFAAMRLVGATPRQVSVVAAVEAGLAAIAGVMLGFALYGLVYRSLGSIDLTGVRSFPGDLSLHSVDVVAVALAVPIACIVSGLLSLRRVQVSPLGVSRRVRPSSPHAWRLVPLAGGLGILAAIAFSRTPTTEPKSDLPWFLLGFLLSVGGLFVAGSWLTAVGARLLGWRTGHPALLLAARRLADNPRASFRAISGLVLALFVTTASIGILATIDSNLGSGKVAASESATVVEQFVGMTGSPFSWTPATVSQSDVRHLEAIPGVRAVTLIHDDQFDHGISITDGEGPIGLVACASLAATLVLGHCRAGESVAAVNPDFFDTVSVQAPTTEAAQAATAWPSEAVSLTRLSRIPDDALLVSTNGTTSTIERVRTALDDGFLGRATPLTMGGISPSTAQVLDQSQRLADLIILASLIVAGCSLAIGAAAGVSERKRAFVLLRLAGTQLGVLQRVVALEGSVPLLAGAIVAISAALVATDLSVHAVLGSTLRFPDGGYYAVVLGGLAASLVAIAATFPLLRRVTDPRVTRSE
jgi:hypothetical protein